jgi:hypothetical protein
MAQTLGRPRHHAELLARRADDVDALARAKMFMRGRTARFRVRRADDTDAGEALLFRARALTGRGWPRSSEPVVPWRASRGWPEAARIEGA